MTCINYEYIPTKGNLDHEEIFDTKEQMNKRYREFTKVKPTAWEQINGEWKRLEGY